MSWLRDAHPFTGAPVVAIACGLLLGAGAARAVQIKNVTVLPRDAKTATIRFDIYWANSWRHEANHDAAWVFFKVRADDQSEWQHVRLAADKVLNPTGYGHGEGTPLDLIVPDGKDGFVGMFVRRATYAARGPLAARNVTAVWDLSANKGITEDTKVSVQALGIEMVYVAEGHFYLGSGGIENGGLYQYTDGSQHTRPYRVTGAGAIPTGRRKGRLWARGAEPEDGGEIPASFPIGHRAFYCMKHRITRAEYTRFLDMLTDEQAEERHPGGPIKRADGSREYKLAGSGYGLQFECRGLSWADGATFAAWAGLRPMTELECVKAVRGPRQPVPDEPCSSYWSVGSFPGSLWHAALTKQGERTVTVGNATGRAFQGTHGDGTLALPADWPQADAVGAGMRCGLRLDIETQELARYRLADRLYAAEVLPQRVDAGWRGVRTAPKGVGH